MSARTDGAGARYAGIDVSKDHLEVALCGGAGTLAGAPCRLPNSAAGLLALRGALERASPRLVAVEATGAYHLPLVRALAAAEIPVAVVDPARVKAFRQRRLERNKTDRQDARLRGSSRGSPASTLRSWGCTPRRRRNRRSSATG